MCAGEVCVCELVYKLQKSESVQKKCETYEWRKHGNLVHVSIVNA